MVQGFTVHIWIWHDAYCLWCFCNKPCFPNNPCIGSLARIHFVYNSTTLFSNASVKRGLVSFFPYTFVVCLGCRVVMVLGCWPKRRGFDHGCGVHTLGEALWWKLRPVYCVISVHYKEYQTVEFLKLPTTASLVIVSQFWDVKPQIISLLLYICHAAWSLHFMVTFLFSVDVVRKLVCCVMFSCNLFLCILLNIFIEERNSLLHCSAKIKTYMNQYDSKSWQVMPFPQNRPLWMAWMLFLGHIVNISVYYRAPHRGDLVAEVLGCWPTGRRIESRLMRLHFWMEAKML